MRHTVITHLGHFDWWVMFRSDPLILCKAGYVLGILELFCQVTINDLLVKALTDSKLIEFASLRRTEESKAQNFHSLTGQKYPVPPRLPIYRGQHKSSLHYILLNCVNCPSTQASDCALSLHISLTYVYSYFPECKGNPRARVRCTWGANRVLFKVQKNNVFKGKKMIQT